MNLFRVRRLTGHLSMPCEVAGVFILALTMVGNQQSLGHLALALFVIAALSALTAYWTGEALDEVGEDPWHDEVDLLALRHDDAVFVSVVLACALAVMALIWMATYAWIALPAEVTWFAGVMALFVSAAMVYAAHLDDQQRQRAGQHGTFSTPSMSHHAS